MKCPNCNQTLLMSQRNNIEIDYCPACRGIWLDKGELDKMLEYVDQSISGARPDVHTVYPDQRPYPAKHYNQHKPYKKKSFLGEMFDFD